MRWWLPLVTATGCAYGMGVSQTAMVGRASNASGTADLTLEQRTVEVTVVGTVGRITGFYEGGLSGVSVRQRRGDAAMQADDLGIGDRSNVGVGYAFALGPFAVSPFVGYGISLANSTLLGITQEGEELSQSAYLGGPNVGVEVLLPRAGLRPYARLGVEHMTGRVVSGLFETAGPEGAEFTSNALLVTFGARVTMGGN